jgi:hypothetical protein
VDSIIAGIDRRWRARRLVFYAVVTVTTALAGFLPFLPTLLSVASMVYVRLAVLREPVQWFGPGRRLVTRFALKLWLVAVGSLTLVLNSLAVLVPFANVPLSGAICLGANVLFVEVALVYLRGRLRREAETGPALESWEWGVPAGLVVATVGALAGAIYGGRMVWQAVAGLLG